MVCQHPGILLEKIGGQDERLLAISSSAHKYYPQIDDFVIGVITKKNFDFYTLDIKGPCEAVLGSYDFEGATKKIKPNLEVGALVFSRVQENCTFLRTRTSCINPKSKKEWVSGEAFFGELKQGIAFDVSLDYCKRLVGQGDRILKLLQKHATFEVAVGANGKIWVKSDSIPHTILIMNALKAAETMGPPQIESLIAGLAPLFATKK